VNDICGGQILKTDTPGGWHFYNVVSGTRYDLTESQFGIPIHYDDSISDRAEALADTTPTRYALLHGRVMKLLARLPDVEGG